MGGLRSSLRLPSGLELGSLAQSFSYAGFSASGASSLLRPERVLRRSTVQASPAPPDAEIIDDPAILRLLDGTEGRILLDGTTW
jgi:hypothetical protein